MRCATGEAWQMIMFDLARTYSETYQCREDETYSSVMANGGEPFACGQPVVARIVVLTKPEGGSDHAARRRVDLRKVRLDRSKGSLSSTVDLLLGEGPPPSARRVPSACPRRSSPPPR